jgi:hypothetical protein
VGNGVDIPNGGTEYAVPNPATGQLARFNGTYTGVLTNFSWNNAGASRTLTVTVKQYEYTGGPSVTSSITRTVTPNTDIVNGIVIIDNITLPISGMAVDNLSAYFTVTVTSTNTSDRFLDFMFIDTEGQLVLINIGTGSGYAYYYLDEPDGTSDVGAILGSTFGRGQATSVTAVGGVQTCLVSGGPLTLDPGLNSVLVYAVEGQPSLAIKFRARWWVDAVAA